ncbi:hypothetical protein ABT124_52005 [Streptomyces sp. NPDC001982]|uniref:hypothetical protein n=1 Tax=unclassified Streptomyces TaxID=2593676 RepID=UPI00331DDB02
MPGHRAGRPLRVRRRPRRFPDWELGGQRQDLAGELDGSSSARLDRTVETLDAPGIEVRGRNDIFDAMWSKWVFVTSIGVVNSPVRATVGDIVAASGGAAFGEVVLAEHPASRTRQAIPWRRAIWQGLGPP